MAEQLPTQQPSLLQAIIQRLTPNPTGAIGQPNSPVAPRVEEGLQRVLDAQGIPLEEFNRQFQK